MEGLEIIERIAVSRVPDIFVIFIVLGCFSVLIPTYIVWLLTKNPTLSFTTEITSGIIYIALMAVLTFSGVLERPTGEYQYKVRITEDAGYVEFTNKYDVIAENDDGTYIIQEKSHIKE